MSLPCSRALSGNGCGANLQPDHRSGSSIVKSGEERMDMIAAYGLVGSYRGAAQICGTKSDREEGRDRGTGPDERASGACTQGQSVQH